MACALSPYYRCRCRGEAVLSVLFEQPYRGDVWRLEVTEHEGRTFGNWRKWYRDGDTLKPTRQGVTIPLDRLVELAQSVTDYFAKQPTAG